MGGSVGKTIKKVASLATGKSVIDAAKGVAKSITGAGDAADINNPQAIMPAGPPTEDAARQQSELENQLRRRRGRASTILTGSQGDNSTVNVGTKTLLG